MSNHDPQPLPTNDLKDPQDPSMKQLQDILANSSGVVVEGNKPLSARALWRDCKEILHGVWVAGAWIIGAQLAVAGIGELLNPAPVSLQTETATVSTVLNKHHDSQVQMAGIRMGLLHSSTVSHHAHLLTQQAIEHQRPDWLAQAGAALLERGSPSEIQALHEELLAHYQSHQLTLPTDAWQAWLSLFSPDTQARLRLALLSDPQGMGQQMESLVSFISEHTSSFSEVENSDENHRRLTPPHLSPVLTQETERLALSLLETRISSALMVEKSAAYARMQAELSQTSFAASPAHLRPLADQFMNQHTTALDDAKAWADAQLAAGFSPSEAWQLWQFKNFIGVPGSTYFSDHVHPALKANIETTQKELAQVKTPAEFKTLLQRWVVKDVQQEEGFWLQRTLSSLEEYDPSASQNASITADGLRLKISEEVLNQPLTIQGLQHMPTDPSSRRSEIQHWLNTTGVQSLTLPQHSWGVQVSQAVAVDFLKEGNAALEKVTQWKGPVLGLDQSMHYRLVPEHLGATYSGVFSSRSAMEHFHLMNPNEKEQLYSSGVLTLRTSSGSWGPLFHEWWHALDYKLSHEHEKFASSERSLSSSLGQVLSSHDHPLEAFARGFLLKTGLHKIRAHFDQEEPVAGPGSVQALMTHLRTLESHPHEQQQAFEEAQARGLLSNEERKRWAASLQTPTWSEQWERFMVSQWARAEHTGVVVRSIDMDKLGPGQWNPDMYWAKPTELLARAFEAHAQQVATERQWWSYSTSVQTGGMWSMVYPTPQERVVMQPQFEGFFAKNQPWWAGDAQISSDDLTPTRLGRLRDIRGDSHPSPSTSTKPTVL